MLYAPTQSHDVTIFKMLECFLNRILYELDFYLEQKNTGSNGLDMQKAFSIDNVWNGSRRDPRWVRKWGQPKISAGGNAPEMVQPDSFSKWKIIIGPFSSLRSEREFGPHGAPSRWPRLQGFFSAFGRRQTLSSFCHPIRFVHFFAFDFIAIGERNWHSAACW